MGRSVDAHIFFGVLTEEGTDFPWDKEEYEHDIEAWWRALKGFKPSVDPWADGWLERKQADRAAHEAATTKYFAEVREFDAAHPLPVELVNVQSADYAMWAIAIKKSIVSAEWGSPTSFDPDSLSITMEQRVAFDQFLIEHQIAHTSTAAWHLSAFSD